MAFDGITVAALTRELSDKLKGARITKIAQPEGDELLISLKGSSGTMRLLLSADASLPLAYLTGENKPSPMTAPGFCMLLRKHIGSGRIVSVTQPSLERIIRFDIEHTDELGDLCVKSLIIELMGKHSNIIFCKNEDGQLTIIDSIKHVSALVSSVREVLPGRAYFIPNTMEKLDPTTAQMTTDEFIEEILSKPMDAAKAIYTSFTGFSPQSAAELIYRAGATSQMNCAALGDIEKESICNGFKFLMNDIRNGSFAPEIIYEDSSLREPVAFSAFHLTMYEKSPSESYESISKLLETYYARKNLVTHMRQRSADLRRIVQNAIERCAKKYDIQQKQLEDTSKMEKLRIYGELLSAYAHEVPSGASSCTLMNYYTNEELTVPLDNTLSALENSRRYFDRYQKLKRTKAASEEQIKETAAQLEYLESVLVSLDIATSEDDLVQIRSELTASGYLRKKTGTKKQKDKSEPLHFISSDGYDIYVGKNNLQNEYITFKLGSGGDWWFHAKKIPGSHVLVKSKGGEDMPDRVFEEAAALAALYSKGREQTLVEVDYLLRKNVKKPGGSPPGFVVYYTNFSMAIDPSIAEKLKAAD